MQTLKDAGLDEIQALCGGCCSCATCHVYVEEPWFNRLGGQKEEEVELLECLSTRKRTSRLSCQIKVTETLDGLQVVIAPEEPGQ